MKQTSFTAFTYWLVCGIWKEENELLCECAVPVWWCVLPHAIREVRDQKLGETVRAHRLNARKIYACGK